MLDKLVLLIQNFGFAILATLSILYALIAGTLFEMLIIFLIIMLYFSLKEEIADKKELLKLTEKYKTLYVMFEQYLEKRDK